MDNCICNACKTEGTEDCPRQMAEETALTMKKIIVEAERAKSGATIGYVALAKKWRDKAEEVEKPPHVYPLDRILEKALGEAMALILRSCAKELEEAT